MRAWRIVRAKHAANAFDGEGARLFGSRWTSSGVRAVFAAESRALAMLEMLVHLGDEWGNVRYVLFEIDVDERDVERLDAATLPAQWRRFPAPVALRAIGDAWVKSARSLALSVPSVVVPQERNLVLNPAHPGFAKLAPQGPVPIELDPRLR